jgi:hypothetical protein
MSKPAPLWGLLAVLTRFAGGSLLGIPLLLLLPGRRPFERPYLTFLSEETYYTTQIFISPLFGVAIWLLMSSIAHLILRLSRKASDFDKILNIIGFGMLVPMPVVWIWDQAMIATNSFQMTVMATSHIIFQVWEILIESIGLTKILGIKISLSICLAVFSDIVFILGAMLFMR